MRAETLISLAGAHGVDLLQAAKLVENQPREDRRALRWITMSDGQRKLVLQANEGEDFRNTANGRGTRSFKRPAYSIAELGQAAKGVPQIQFWAACFAFAGSHGYSGQLHAALWKKAVELKDRYDWPPLVKDIHGLQRPYLEWLAKLVLDEDRCPNEFAVCPPLYAWYLQIEPRVWERDIAGRFQALRFVWLQWLGTAAASIQARLSESEQ